VIDNLCNKYNLKKDLCFLATCNSEVSMKMVLVCVLALCFVACEHHSVTTFNAVISDLRVTGSLALGETVETVSACGFSAKGEGRTLIFRTTNYALECSLLKNGDMIQITKVVTTSPGGEGVRYHWYVGEKHDSLYPETVR
jgi:hypothetical protein